MKISEYLLNNLPLSTFLFKNIYVHFPCKITLPKKTPQMYKLKKQVICPHTLNIQWWKRDRITMVTFPSKNAEFLAQSSHHSPKLLKYCWINVNLLYSEIGNFSSLVSPFSASDNSPAPLFYIIHGSAFWEVFLFPHFVHLLLTRAWENLYFSMEQEVLSYITIFDSYSLGWKSLANTDPLNICVSEFSTYLIPVKDMCHSTDF